MTARRLRNADFSEVALRNFPLTAREIVPAVAYVVVVATRDGTVYSRIYVRAEQAESRAERARANGDAAVVIPVAIAVVE
jgi:hypothetical protein